MAIQVWDGTKYVGAELGRFGPTGTLKEALVWDGTQYVKVWPSLPVVTIVPGAAWDAPRSQFRQACIDYGTTYDTVEILPFAINLDPGVDSINSMFDGCAQLLSIPMFDTSNIVDMGSLFLNCSSLMEVPPLDTSNVTSMFAMFTGCSSLTSIPPLNTTKVTSLSSVFSNCRALVEAPNLTSTAAVTSMRSMFYNCKSLQYVPDMNTANVTTVNEMFRLCENLSDGNVRLIGKHPSVTTTNMILGSGLTREPFRGAGGTITGRTLSSNVLTTLATHTITAEEGSNLKLLQMTLAWGNATATKSIRIDRNGVQVATATGQNPVATAEVVCNVGDVITYKATVNSATTANRVINSGTWGAWNR